MSEVTQILEAIQAGDPLATDQLLPLVYEELRQLAAVHLGREARENTLEPTALVHEAYLRLVGGDGPIWQNSAHFFGAAAESMRRILIDRARARRSDKRGGGARQLDLQELELAVPPPDDELLALDEALAQFAVLEPLKAQLVKLRFFAGLSVVQAAEVLGISRATADRHWAYSRAWLFHTLRADE